MPENLLPDLLLPNVDHLELLTVIQQHYRSSRSTTDDDVVYPNADPYALKIRHKDGRITMIEPGPVFSVQELEALQEKVRTQLVESPGTAVEVCIMFSSSPVKGSFTHPSGRVQILPAPPQAPRPPVLYADHPFVLEFPIRQSHNGFITTQRRTRGVLEWTWILNVLLRANIKSIGPRSGHMWALCLQGREGPPTQAQVQWAQEYYMIDSFKLVQDEFTKTSPLLIPEMHHGEYYAARYIVSDDLVIPDSLSGLLDRVANLSADDHRRFMRATQWMYVANAVWDHHVSSSYIALVAAIESLAHRSTSSKPCQTCGKDTSPGPTQRFQDFIEEHAPTPGAAENKKWLYHMRSDLVHGLYLLQFDESVFGLPLTTTYLEQSGAYTDLYQIVRLVLVNWLQRRESGTA